MENKQRAGGQALGATQNTLGMTLISLSAGDFQMGAESGRGCDEGPVHTVHISGEFAVGECPVTNAQYERFDPEHRRFRGKRGVSSGDDEAVTYVSWHDAVAFCTWLSEQEGRPYRLPTEAEWEYACRAGTRTAYWTGDGLPAEFHRNQPSEGDWSEFGTKADADLREKKGTVPVDLTVGKTPANPWGLRDVHGIVEEWCHDWYGPYPAEPETDPIGPEDGLSKVTRGGSHDTYVDFLKSAERHAAIPEDRHWLIGFRVVAGPRPDGTARPAVKLSLNDPTVTVEPPAGEPSAAKWTTDATWRSANRTSGSSAGASDQKTLRAGATAPTRSGDSGSGMPAEQPLFIPPIPFVRPDSSDTCHSWLHHHHHPSITWCENGDLLACWFNTRSEIGREMRVLSSRLRAGRDEWETARLFFDVADRNTSGSTVFHDGLGVLYYFGGVSESSHHRDQCMVMARSTDSGRTWTRPRIISSTEDRHKYTPLDSVIALKDGSLVVAVDYAPPGYKANECGAGVFMSPDGGESWDDRISGKDRPNIRAGGSGGLIAGFHTAIVQREDGSLLAFGRTNADGGLVEIDGRMPQSVSADMGRTWRYSASPFPPVGGGQRIAMLRLQEGPILFCSFTDRNNAEPSGMRFVGADGKPFTGYGLFAAVSDDDGESWPIRRLLSPGGEPRTMDGGGNTHEFHADDTHAEPRGYLAITQTPDGVIHLLSSRNHYRFNLPWLREAVLDAATNI